MKWYAYYSDIGRYVLMNEMDYQKTCRELEKTLPYAEFNNLGDAKDYLICNIKNDIEAYQKEREIVVKDLDEKINFLREIVSEVRAKKWHKKGET